MKTICLMVGLLVVSSSLLAGLCQANVPAPPVNQQVGFWDKAFDSMSESDCRGCHGETLAEKHHLLITTRNLSCTTCHQMDCSSGVCELEPFRDCSLCHTQNAGQGSVHHLAQAAQSGNCVSCHGDLVQNRGDGHYIPVYGPSMVTPRPSAGTGINGRGGCDACHTWGNDWDTGEVVYASKEAHHETGMGQDSGKCAWCHDAQAAAGLKIRACEECHAPQSLHNIQLDTNNNDIIEPGAEQAYRGHIGNNEDCLGCHGGAADQISIGEGAGWSLHNPTRHHLLVQAKGKKCLDCHSLSKNLQGVFVFNDFRTCSVCHKSGGRRP